MNNKYCLYTQTGSGDINFIGRNLQGIVQAALNNGCTLQGGVSISEWSKVNTSPAIILSQAVLCPEDPIHSCEQLGILSYDNKNENLVVDVNGEVGSITFEN